MSLRHTKAMRNVTHPGRWWVLTDVWLSLQVRGCAKQEMCGRLVVVCLS